MQIQIFFKQTWWHSQWSEASPIHACSQSDYNRPKDVNCEAFANVFNYCTSETTNTKHFLFRFLRWCNVTNGFIKICRNLFKWFCLERVHTYCHRLRLLWGETSPPSPLPSLLPYSATLPSLLCPAHFLFLPHSPVPGPNVPLKFS